MKKNIQWDIKTKIATALIVFFAVFTAIFFESTSRDWTSVKMILTQLAASAAFSAYVLTTLNEKSYSLVTVQGMAMVLAIVFALGVSVSRDLYSHDVLRMLLYLPLLLICSQAVVLTPVAALISVYLALELGGVAVICLPAAVGASLTYLSYSVKESAVWKKILFAGSELVLIAATVYSFVQHRYTLSVHSFVTDIWDSIGLVVAVVFFVALVVVSIMKKRTLGEMFGCVAAAGLAVVLMFMHSGVSLPASTAMLMTLPVICQDGLPAEEMCEKAFDTIKSKIKK